MPRQGGEDLPPDCWQLILKNVDDKDLEAVSLVCKSFLTNSNIVKESLHVFDAKVNMLSQLFKRFTRLKKVDLSRNLRDNLDEALCQVGLAGLNLESLNISCPEVPFETETLRETLGSNPNTKNLKTLSCNWIILLDEDELQVITNLFPSLEELNIGHNKIGYRPSVCLDDGIKFLASKLKFLKKIHISGKNPISDGSIIYLSENCIFLKDVALIMSSGHGVTKNGIGHLLRNARNLEALQIAYIKKNSSSSVQSSTITIENSISHAEALTSLEFRSVDISDGLLMAVADSKLRLEYLGIQGICFHLISSGILYNYLLKLGGLNAHVKDGDNNIPLAEYSKIRQLNLGRNLISDKELKHFGLIFPNIKVLDLSCCYEVTSIGIEAILKSCKYVRELNLYSYRKAKIIEANSDLLKVNLEVLKLPGSCIDGEGLAVIETKCPQLVDLDLNLCQNVTTENIKQLVRNIKTLTCLHLMFCSQIDIRDLLEWMLSTGNLASLKKISIAGAKDGTTMEQRDQFLLHGCLLIYGCPSHVHEWW